MLITSVKKQHFVNKQQLEVTPVGANDNLSLICYLQNKIIQKKYQDGHPLAFNMMCFVHIIHKAVMVPLYLYFAHWMFRARNSGGRAGHAGSWGHGGRRMRGGRGERGECDSCESKHESEIVPTHNALWIK